MKKTPVYIILTALLLTLFCGCRDDGVVDDGDVPDVSPIISVTPGTDDDDDNGIIPGDNDDNGIIPGDDDEDAPDVSDAIVSASPKTAPSAVQ